MGNVVGPPLVVGEEHVHVEKPFEPHVKPAGHVPPHAGCVDATQLTGGAEEAAPHKLVTELQIGVAGGQPQSVQQFAWVSGTVTVTGLHPPPEQKAGRGAQVQMVPFE